MPTANASSIFDIISSHAWSMVGLLIPKTHLKRSRPIGSKDKNSWMRKGAKMQDDLLEKVKIPKDSFDIINDSVLE